MLVGYMRVSTADERQSVALQRDALIAAGVDERHLHQDRDTGSRDDRPGLKACLADVRSGDVLVVWKLDRLGRSLSHLLKIVAELKERGVAFRSLTEQMDTTTPHGEFLFSVFGALAQYERALIQERVTAGLEAARRRGRKGGRPPSSVATISSTWSEPMETDMARPPRPRRLARFSTPVGSVGLQNEVPPIPVRRAPRRAAQPSRRADRRGSAASRRSRRGRSSSPPCAGCSRR